MDSFRKYRRTQIAELRPYKPGDSLDRVSISQADRENGSPKLGDMIARNPKLDGDMWLVAAQYFADNFEPLPKPRNRVLTFIVIFLAAMAVGSLLALGIQAVRPAEMTRAEAYSLGYKDAKRETSRPIAWGQQSKNDWCYPHCRGWGQ